MSNRNHKSGWRQALLDDLENSETVKEQWKNGPVRNEYRKVTDKCCCIIFILLVLSLIGVAIYVFFVAQPGNLNKTYDSEGNVCGEGKAADYPYLYFQNFDAPYKTVCVKACTQFDYNAIKYNVPYNKQDDGAAVNPEYPGPLYYQEFSKNYGGPSYTDKIPFDEKEAFAFNKDWANGYFTEEQWNKYEDSVKVECLPNSDVPSCEGANFYTHDSLVIGDKFCGP